MARALVIRLGLLLLYFKDLSDKHLLSALKSFFQLLCPFKRSHNSWLKENRSPAMWRDRVCSMLFAT